MQQDVEAFCAALFEVQMAPFPRLAANVATLDRLMGPVGTPSTAADAASAATADAEWRHRELLKEICRGNTD